MSKTQDFGNKIGGARKDVWKSRGLILDDIIDMNDGEKNKYINKNNVWIKPNYQEMVSNGKSVRIAYFTKLIRDALPTTPIRNTEEYQQGFINFISDIRDKTLAIKKDSEILTYFNDVILKYVTKQNYSYTANYETYGCLNNKLFKASQLRSFINLDNEIAKKQFLYTEEQKILADYSFYKYENVTWDTDYNNKIRVSIKLPFGTAYMYPTEDYAIEDNWKRDTYFILDKRHNIIGNNFESIDEAKAIILESQKEKNIPKETKKRKTKLIPPQLSHINRVGDDYRNNHNITGEDMLNVFGFYGGEFGNWLNENDRQQNLNFSYDAFVDLAKALNISSKDIAFNGELSIAYGARGRSSALAHYEPLRKVINLTKMKGAGSLAHEWGHSLDHYLGKVIAGKDDFLTNTYNSLAKKIRETMHYKTVSAEELKTNYPSKYEQYKNLYDYHKKNIDGSIKVELGYEYIKDNKEEIQKLIDELLNKDITKEEYLIAKTENKYSDTLNELSKYAFYKDIGDKEKKLITYELFTLTEKRNELNNSRKVETNFYKNSIKFDKMFSKEDKGYWQSDCEMFARAFACYVKDKLSPNTNDYLCGHSENAITRDNITDEVIKAFPEGEERKSINKCFDELIEIVKEKNLFKEFNKNEVTFSTHKDTNEVLKNLSNNDFEQINFSDFLTQDNDIDICEDF